MIIYKRDILVFGLGITIIAMNIANVIVENVNSTEGEKLATIREEVREVEKQNIIIRNKILDETAYTVIATKAAAMGFEEVQSRDTLILK